MMQCKSVRRIDVLISLKISSLVLGPVHTTLGKFKIGGFTLKSKMHEMFSVQTMLEKFKTQQSLVIVDLCLRKTRAEKSRDYHDVIVFIKLRFQNVFRPH